MLLNLYSIGVNFLFTSQIHAIGVYFFLNFVIKYVKDIRQTYRHSASIVDGGFSNSREGRHVLQHVFTALFTNSTSNASLLTQN